MNLSNPFAKQHLKLMVIPQKVHYIGHLTKVRNACQQADHYIKLAGFLKLRGTQLGRLQHIGDALHRAGLQKKAMRSDQQLREDHIVRGGFGVRQQLPALLIHLQTEQI